MKVGEVSVRGKLIKIFFSGGEEYRIYQAVNGNGIFELYRWEEYDEPILIYQEDDMEDMYYRIEEIYEANADYDWNL